MQQVPEVTSELLDKQYSGCMSRLGEAYLALDRARKNVSDLKREREYWVAQFAAFKSHEQKTLPTNVIPLKKEEKSDEPTPS